jgi:hypothetical protein
MSRAGDPQSPKANNSAVEARVFAAETLATAARSAEGLEGGGSAGMMMR